MATAPPAAEQKKPASTAPPAKQATPSSGKTPDVAKAPTQDAKAPGATNSSATPAASGQRFDRMAVRAKLAVSEPGDAVEREADQIADRVMRAPDPKAGAAATQPSAKAPQDSIARAPQAPSDANKAKTPAAGAPAIAAPKPSTPSGTSDMKRAAAPTRAEAPAAVPAGGRATPAGSAKDDVKRKAAAPSGTAQPATDRPGTTQELLARLGPGAPLDADSRAYFETRLGCDLSDVRIHTDAAAALAARELAARAFAFGNHLAFAEGEYQPESEHGKRLLAHELAHVLQQSHDVVPRMIMRDSTAPAAATPSTDQFIVKNAELEVPPIKSRHVLAYKGKADNDALRRKGAYDASKRGTKQMDIWLGSAKPDIKKIPAEQRPSTASGMNLNLNVAGGAKVKSVPAADEAALLRLLQVPTWDSAGADVQYQVDHMVEFQLGGDDAIENMELLNQAHNGSVGSSFSHGIKRTIREEIQADPKNPALIGYTGPRSAAGEPTAEGVMEAKTVVFKRVKLRARESGRKEKDSTTWSLQQINALDHVLPLLGGGGKLDGSATSFALLSPTGSLLIAQFAHDSGQTKISVGENQSGGMAGFTTKQIVLKTGYNDTTAGGEIGTLQGVLNLGPKVTIPPGNVSVPILQAKSPGTYSGKLSAATPTNLPNPVDFTPMSPLNLSNITFGTSVFGKALLHPKHPALDGLSIPAEIRDGRLGIFYTVDATALAKKLNFPGVTIDTAAISIGYDGSEFIIGGGTEFTIKNFGTGNLNASVDTAGDFQLEGGIRADTRLFDQANMQLWYRSKGGFGGKGILRITTPNKITGIKSAQITVAYENGAFTAGGDVQPDIPGLKSAALTVTYAKETLQITGKLGIDKSVPGVKSADITVSVTQNDQGWKVAATGDVTPNLPGLSGAQLKFKYDDGLVLVEGDFAFKKGPLDGKVKAGVTNAKVDAEGNRESTGSGKTLVVFGAAKIKAEFIKDKLSGTLNLRLLPDGSVKVGGDLGVPDFEVFGKFPKTGSEFLNKTFTTPSIPIPGLGFAVGSVTVGVTFSASISANAHASIGPGKLTGIKVTVEEFDPATVTLDTLAIGGEGSFNVYADAGFGVGAKLNLEFGAAIAKVKGSIGAEAKAGIPPDKPILSATPKFTYSYAKGLDIQNDFKLDISPELKFRLFGEVSADLNLLIDTITVWKKDWTLAEADYKLPVSIKASGSLGYNSKTGKITPENPRDAINLEQPKLDENVMKDVVMGNSAPPAVKTLDKNKKELSDEDQLMCTPAKSRNFTPARSKAPVSTPNQSVMTKRDNTSDPPPPERIDDGLIGDLGTGMPLDLATRGFFEQHMGTDFSAVRIFVGPQANRAAKRVSARAFTVGHHIVFADGEYDPHSESGKALLAHELAHVQQQNRGVTRQVMRAGQGDGKGAGKKGEDGKAKDTGPKYEVEAPLELPPIKSRHAWAYSKKAKAGSLIRPRKYLSSERGTNQIGKWRKAAPIDVRANIPKADHPKAPGEAWKLDLQAEGGARVKTIKAASDKDLVEQLQIPAWDVYGKAVNFEVDHQVEIQLGGDDEPTNMELLDKSHNASTGSSFAGAIKRTIKKELAKKPPPPIPDQKMPAKPSEDWVMDRYTIVFKNVAHGEEKPKKEKSSLFWSLEAINACAPIVSLLPPGEKKNLTGDPKRLVLQSPTGALVIGRFPVEGSKVSVEAEQSGGVGGLTITSIKITSQGGAAKLDSKTIQEGTTVGTLTGIVDPEGTTKGKKKKTTKKQTSIDLVMAKQSHAVRLNDKIPDIETDIGPFSPTNLTNITIGKGVFATAAIHPSHPALAGLTIPAEVRNGKLGLFYTIDATTFAERLKVPGLKVDDASITLGYDGEAFSVAGGAEFTIRNFGTGSLEAGIDSNQKFQLEGGFHADTRLFDRADMKIWYRSETGFGGEGTLAIDKPGKIRGIKNASVNASYNAGVFAATGTVQPNIPGVQNANLSVRYGPDEMGADSILIEGDLLLAAGIPGIDEGKVHVSVLQRDDDWHVSAKGDITPRLPGLNPVIKVIYDDGLFTGEARAEFVKSIFSGQATVGLTNRAVTPEGELSGTEPGDHLRLYGKGLLTARVTDWLQGTVGVKVKPSGTLLISGRIGVPAAVTVFEQFPPPDRATRELFHMPTLSVPLFGFAVGGNVVGIALTISGRVTGHAFVGPGQLTQAEINVIDFDPAQPDSLHLTGRAQFRLPGEAGVDAELDAGVSAGAAVIRVTAGVGVTAGAAVQANVTPTVDLDWKPATGLHLHADLAASLSPKLRFGVKGYAEVVADAFVTSFTLWRKDWNLAQREIGSSLALGLNVPVDYYSDGRGVVFDPNRVSFQVPALGLDTFKELLGGSSDART